ncbi:MAG: YHS domain-containing protein [Betaproteobacteria bacterium]|nr:YHS domain-containing protein [Betaproteobacteria bacterium]
MRKILKILLCAPFVFAAVAASAAEPAKPMFVWYQYESAIGADGYDVVAYFTENEAARGDAEFAAEYDGQIWHFASAANRDIFTETPEKYAPQYGGYCAYAASLNARAFGDPLVWTVHNDKLYFNYNPPTRARWEPGVNGRITKADIYWRDEVLAEFRAQ